jgi:hypothetical protein
MRPILDAVLDIHDRLDAGGIRHAFGGAFALLWCTGEPRTTIDIDVNVFASPNDSRRIAASLPPDVAVTDADIEALERDGQIRLLLDGIPIDLFMNTSPFHADVQLRTITHELSGRQLPFLSCSDLTVFKAFFNRRKDWADIEEMIRAGTVDLAHVAGVLVQYLGPDDERIRKLAAIDREVAGEAHSD